MQTPLKEPSAAKCCNKQQMVSSMSYLQECYYSHSYNIYHHEI